MCGRGAHHATPAGALPEVQNRMGELVAFGRVAATAKVDVTSALASMRHVMTLMSEPLKQ